MAGTIDKCRACGSRRLVEFLDLGLQYTSDFRIDTSKPPKYPLRVVFCRMCKLVQLSYTTPQSEMYHQNYGFKSGISEAITADLQENVTQALAKKPNAQDWLDIASNDGTLLSFVPKNIYRVGVDPIGFLCEQATQHADKIVNNYFTATDFIAYNPMDSRAEYQKFDIITSISCFYDMPEPDKFVGDVSSILAYNGVWVVQQNYLLTTMQLNAVDNVCHEHLEYYTLLSLENILGCFGLEVFDLSLPTVNGGSIRTFIAHQGTYPIQDAVERQRAIELDYGLNTIEPYKRYAAATTKELKDLKRLLRNINDNGQTCFILAASTRGATIWQSAGIDYRLVQYAVERNPAKVGKYFSAIGIPIISEAEARERKPDYMLVGPWFFADQIIDREKDYLKQGGRLIVPLPELRVVSGENLVG